MVDEERKASDFESLPTNCYLRKNTFLGMIYSLLSPLPSFFFGRPWTTTLQEIITAPRSVGATHMCCNICSIVYFFLLVLAGIVILILAFVVQVEIFHQVESAVDSCPCSSFSDNDLVVNQVVHQYVGQQGCSCLG